MDRSEVDRSDEASWDHLQSIAKYWYRQGKDDGAEHECAKIVAWLRRASNGDETIKYASLFADEIEAGEHLK